MPFTATERLFLTADGKVVKEGDPAAVSLLVGEGGTLTDEQAAQYGLTAAPAPTVDAKAAAPKANKMLTKAPANKGG